MVRLSEHFWVCGITKHVVEPASEGRSASAPIDVGFNPCWAVLRTVLLFVVLAWQTAPFAAAQTNTAPAPRTRTLFDADWRFTVGDPPKAQNAAFSDSAWRTLTLPHDWSIEGRIDAKNPMGGQGGFFPAGVGWYRKHLTVRPSWRGKRVSVEFEGVYMNADVWLNGNHITTHPYGYTTFHVDLTRYLKPGNDNVLAVRVDNSAQKNSRWYSGSGIYRHVWLTVTNPVHVAPWGVFVSTPKADANAATVAVATTLVNEGATPQDLTLTTTLWGPDNKVGDRLVSKIRLASGTTQEIAQEIVVFKPALWSPETPQRYRAVSQVQVSGTGKMVDALDTPVGLRTLSWSADKGLLLNGAVIKLNGGCVHHDNGVLGAAAFDRAEERKVELLKASGFNELRMAHNPPSPALLDACDRLGMLIMDEAFDSWVNGKNKYDYSVQFKDWWERDLDSMVLRDRNHPSVIFWSLGNEIRGIYGPMGAEYGPKLAARVHNWDTTRPVTNGILRFPDQTPASQAAADANWNTLDIVGSNYSLFRHIAQHDKFPNRVLVSTESTPGNPAKLWAQVMENVFVIGDNVWAAQDYLGESGTGRWFYEGDPTEPVLAPRNGRINPVFQGSDLLYPWHGANPGDLDLIGNRKPMAHWRNIVWNRGEKIYGAVRQPQNDKKIIVTGWGWTPTWDSWTWPGQEGKPMEVEVYSRYPAVRLYLNDKLVGEQETNPTTSFRAVFSLPYQPGTLKAVGVENGKEAQSWTLETAGEPAALRLTPDRATIHAGEEDLSFVNVEVVDKNGRVAPNADQSITFFLSGSEAIAGLGNANLKSDDAYQGNTCRVFHGKALIVIRSTKKAGTITLKAQANGLPMAQTVITVK